MSCRDKPAALQGEICDYLGDTYSETFSVTNEDGTGPEDLTGAAIVCYIRNQTTNAVEMTLNATDSGGANGIQISNAEGGVFRYRILDALKVAASIAVGTYSFFTQVTPSGKDPRVVHAGTYRLDVDVSA